MKSKVLAAAASVLASSSLLLGVAGSNLIKDSEGKHNATYRDPVGIPTVCWGHTSPHLRMGMRFTDAECDLLFRSDVAKHQVVLRGPKNCIRSAPLTPNQLDAVTSLTFNIGNGAFCRSTMARKLAARDYAGASQEFPKWVYAGGRKLRGLEIRRNKEQALFNTPIPAKPSRLKALLSWQGLFG